MDYMVATYRPAIGAARLAGPAAAGAVSMSARKDQRTGARIRGTPNPFNPRTKIAIDVPGDGVATLHVTDVAGRVAATLIDGAFYRVDSTNSLRRPRHHERGLPFLPSPAVPLRNRARRPYEISAWGRSPDVPRAILSLPTAARRRVPRRASLLRTSEQSPAPAKLALLPLPSPVGPRTYTHGTPQHASGPRRWIPSVDRSCRPRRRGLASTARSCTSRALGLVSKCRSGVAPRDVQ